MKNNELVSFIVPVYNVEKYIKKLVESIQKQTYENYEIILVDDGSKDNSGKIIDDLAKNDSKIKVIHKENGGVSSARNIGLKKSVGSIILFIDGDDYIDEDYAFYFYNLIKNSNCDIAVNMDFYSVYENNYAVKDGTIMDNKSIIKMMYYDDINVAVWNKAYKREFLINNNILFDETVWFGEGMLFNINCFNLVDQIAVGNKKVYHQVWNSESAMRKFNLKSNLCGIRSLQLQKEILNTDDKKIMLAWKYHLRCFNRSILIGILKSNSKDEYIDEFKKCKKNLRKDLFVVFKSNISIKRKVYYFLMALFPETIAKRDINKERKYK